METPFIRAKAKDNVDALDSLIVYLDSSTKEEIVEYIDGAFKDIEKVLEHAAAGSMDPLATYRTFVKKFHEYWNAPPA